MRASGQLYAPVVLLPEFHTLIPRTGSLVGAGTFWRREKSLAYRESNPGSSRPHLSHYADWATAAQHYSVHRVVAAHCKLNLWLLWHTIFAVLNRVQWFPSLKPLQKHLAGKRCATDADAKQAVTSWLDTSDSSPTEIKALAPRWDKCCNVDGEYVEVWCVSSATHVPCNNVLGIKVLPYYVTHPCTHTRARARTYTHTRILYVCMYVCVCVYMYIYIYITLYPKLFSS
jgi:hypothetical protein